MSEKLRVTLKNWRLSDLRKHTVVSGQVFGHPRFEDKTYIKSAPLVHKELRGDVRENKIAWVESAQVIYDLEGPQK